MVEAIQGFVRARFGTNARNLRGLSTVIRRRTSSLAPAALSFGTNAVSGLPYAAARVTREEQLIREPRFEQRHHQRHHLRITAAALAIESHVGTASADRLVHVDVRVVEIAEMADGDASGIDAGIFEKIELLERGFSGDAGVREDRQVRREMRLAHRTKHFALDRRDLVPGADLAERAGRILVGLPNECAGDLLLAHRRHWLRVKRLRVETRALDDGQTGFLRRLANEAEVHARAFEPGVDDAGDAVALRGAQFLGHELDIPHWVRACGSRRRTCRRRTGCRALRGEHGRSGRAESVAEIGPE